jgi:hypothetical protein
LRNRAVATVSPKPTPNSSRSRLTKRRRWAPTIIKTTPVVRTFQPLPWAEMAKRMMAAAINNKLTTIPVVFFSVMLCSSCPQQDHRRFQTNRGSAEGPDTRGQWSFAVGGS